MERQCSPLCTKISSIQEKVHIRSNERFSVSGRTQQIQSASRASGWDVSLYSGICVITGAGTESRRAVGEDVPVQSAVGYVMGDKPHALLYEHPTTVVCPPTVSDASNHPLPTFKVAVLPAAVNDVPDSVAIVPVGVYVGMRDIGDPAGRPDIVVGGQAL